MDIEFWRGNLKEIDHIREEDLGVDDRLILQGILGK
jgi:hypothetical protein